MKFSSQDTEDISTFSINVEARQMQLHIFFIFTYIHTPVYMCTYFFGIVFGLGFFLGDRVGN